MGLFDTLILYCPNCGNENEIQTKAGPCGLDTYRFDTAPPAIMDGMVDWPQKCHVCSKRFTVKRVQEPVYTVVEHVEEDTQ